MWFGTAHGLYCYEGNKFKVFLNEKDHPASLSNNIITSLFIDQDHNMWVGTNNGLNRYNPHKESFDHFFHDPGDSNTIINDYTLTINQDNKGDLWIGTLNGISAI